MHILNDQACPNMGFKYEVPTSEDRAGEYGAQISTSHKCVAPVFTHGCRHALTPVWGVIPYSLNGGVVRKMTAKYGARRSGWRWSINNRDIHNAKWGGNLGRDKISSGNIY